MVQVFLSLGSNLGKSEEIVLAALGDISNLSYISNFKYSSLYLTSPVSEIPQNYYINAVCTFETLQPVDTLLRDLQDIEKAYGKIPKAKNMPRLLDVDILLYGQIRRRTESLTLPHPKMLERLFVLIPLLEITKEVDYPTSPLVIESIDIEEWCNTLENPNQEEIKKLMFTGVK